MTLVILWHMLTRHEGTTGTKAGTTGTKALTRRHDC